MGNSWKYCVTTFVAISFWVLCSAQKRTWNYNSSGELYCIFAYRDTIGCDTLILRDVIGTTTSYSKNLGGCKIGDLFLPERSMRNGYYYRLDDEGPDFWMSMIECSWSSDDAFVELSFAHERRGYSDYYCYSTKLVEQKFKSYSEFKHFWKSEFKRNYIMYNKIKTR